MRYRGFQPPALNAVWVLIAINVLAYLATSVVSHSTNLSNTLAIQFGISRIDFLSQPWTIVTAMFIHAGIFHILFNMLTLYYYGTFVLNLIGETKFLAVYFIGGIVGNAVFMLLAPYSLAVGASGAIFSLGGVLAVMRPRIKVVLFPLPIPMDLWIAIILGFVLISFVGGIAWQAHLGGLVTGLVAGYLFRRRELGRRGWY